MATKINKISLKTEVVQSLEDKYKAMETYTNDSYVLVYTCDSILYGDGMICQSKDNFLCPTQNNCPTHRGDMCPSIQVYNEDNDCATLKGTFCETKLVICHTDLCPTPSNNCETDFTCRTQREYVCPGEGTTRVGEKCVTWDGYWCKATADK